MTQRLPWFAARLLFESAPPPSDPTAILFEERVVLIKSERGIEDASEKAKDLGRNADLEYANPDGETIAWRFKEVLDVVQLNEPSIGEGSEVYHHYLRPEEVKQIRESLRSGSL